MKHQLKIIKHLYSKQQYVINQWFTKILQNHYCGTSEYNDFHAALLVKSIMLNDAILLITENTIKLKLNWIGFMVI